MCGITGIYHSDKGKIVDKDILHRMIDIMKYRGPDGSGSYTSGSVGLGHRRLSIIDLETGDQPMFSDDGRIAIVFNGEIYNYIEIRNELEGLGHQFHTRSDTEVIIHAYQQWSRDCLSKFNGMWAIALWDGRSQELFISRDRIGEKPLFYAQHNGAFLFGSEIKCILAADRTFEKNIERIELLLTFAYCPSPFTFYQGIMELEPGHYLLVANGNVRKVRYWTMPQTDESDMEKNQQSVAERFSALLSDSVRIRMRSDVPFGAFLSGGLDSSTIVNLMSRISNHPVESFTMGFDEQRYDERELARCVASHFGANHHEHIIRQDSLDESLDQVVWHYDQPFGDTTAVAIGYLSRSVHSQGVKMILTGDGGDEVLSGYNAYKGERFVSGYRRIPRPLRQVGMMGLNGFESLRGMRTTVQSARVRRVMETAEMTPDHRILVKASFLRQPALLNRLLEGVPRRMNINEYFSDFMSHCTFVDGFYRLMYFDLLHKLPGDHLTKVDRMTMAHSIEARTPFLDYRLVEMMAAVDKNVKMHCLQQKSVLRNAFGRSLPKELLSARKRGFSVPVTEWFKEKEFVDRITALQNLKDIGMNVKVLNEIVLKNRTGEQDFGHFLWLLLVLDRWLGSSRTLL